MFHESIIRKADKGDRDKLKLENQELWRSNNVLKERLFIVRATLKLTQKCLEEASADRDRYKNALDYITHFAKSASESEDNDFLAQMMFDKFKEVDK